MILNNYIEGNIVRTLALVLASVLVVLAAAAPTASAELGKQGYIVQVRTNPSDAAERHGIPPKHLYRALQGFAAMLNDKQVERLKADSDIVKITADAAVKLNSGTTTRASSSGQVVPTGVSRIGASIAAPSTRVGVAVIDTGVAKVADLQRNMPRKGHKSCVASDPSPFSDGYNHGTHVAGTIGAVGNTVGVVGVNPNVNIHSVKVYNSGGYATWSELLCGVDWVTTNAVAYGIRVVNMSLAGPGDYPPFRQAIAALRNAGVTIVVAAGNSATDATTWNPAGYDESVIAVSALSDSDGKAGGLGASTWSGADDTFAGFSNYGSVVDCAAPGVDVLSTLPSGGYGRMSGTSMAAPHVAGLASRMLAASPSLSWTQVRDRMVAGGESLGAGHSDPSGRHPEPICLAG